MCFSTAWDYSIINAAIKLILTEENKCNDYRFPPIFSALLNTNFQRSIR